MATIETKKEDFFFNALLKRSMRSQAMSTLDALNQIPSSAATSAALSALWMPKDLNHGLSDTGSSFSSRFKTFAPEQKALPTQAFSLSAMAQALMPLPVSVRTKAPHKMALISDLIESSFRNSQQQLEVNPHVKFQLQTHLINAQRPSQAHGLKVGTTEQLSGAVKIFSSESVDRCVSRQAGLPTCYPKLPKGQHLVALVDRLIDVQVYAIYSLDQMVEMDNQRHSPAVIRMDWKVLEIPQSVEAELLKDMSLEDGIIIAPLEALGWVK